MDALPATGDDPFGGLIEDVRGLERSIAVSSPITLMNPTSRMPR